MILVTGANGKFGRAIIKNLVANGAHVAAFELQESSRKDLQDLGVEKVFIGDLRNYEDEKNAYADMEVVYHICSGFNPDEIEMGEIAIQAAIDTNLPHLMFHSVLHSINSDMPHHNKKHIVEEKLISSGIPYTIIQPCCLMQNLQGYFEDVRSKGVFRQNYLTSGGKRLCFADVEDIGEAIAKILMEHENHIGATYELCGSKNVTLDDVCAIFSKVLGKPVHGECFSEDYLVDLLTKGGKSEYYISSALKMFRHYDADGFIGNPYTLKSLLGREPKGFEEFIREKMQG
ncbi:MAG: NmrA family NAD(P)-binding protein [Lachnospiraceae bacterium]|nr:NmrA family NAD(P)-binding protein [Lachnospiraceae bacterium]